MFENYLLIAQMRMDSDISIGTGLMRREGIFDLFFLQQDKTTALIIEFRLKKNPSCIPASSCGL